MSLAILRSKGYSNLTTFRATYPEAFTTAHTNIFAKDLENIWTKIFQETGMSNDKAIDNAITLPTDTVIRDGEESYVFVLGSDGKAQKRKVTSGADNGEVLVISSGLKAGEKVIFRGQDYLDDGDSVRVVTE